MEKDTIPAPPPSTLDAHSVGLAMLQIVLSENRTMRQSLREFDAVKEGDSND